MLSARTWWLNAGDHLRPAAVILGLPVHDVLVNDVVRLTCYWLHEEADRLHHIVTLNPEMVMTARRFPDFRSVVRHADLVTPDGIGILLAARLLGTPLRGRATGVEITQALAQIGDPQLRLFLLGAAPGVADRAAQVLRQRFPTCQVVGCFAGSPSDADAPAALEMIARTRPTVLLVAYGAPAQERWIARHRALLEAYGVVVALGVGGTFDYLAGIVPLPPTFVRRFGFEWLYRLMRQPWRWRRQLALPRFATLVLVEAVRRRVLKKGMLPE